MRPGSSTRFSHETRLLLSQKPSPSRMYSELYQLETVVNGAGERLGEKGHASRNTGGRMCVHVRPPSGNLADGVPTVSPIVKYRSWSGTLS